MVAGATLVNVSQTTNSIGELPFDPDEHLDEWYVGYGAEGHWESNSGMSHVETLPGPTQALAPKLLPSHPAEQAWYVLLSWPCMEALSCICNSWDAGCA